MRPNVMTEPLILGSVIGLGMASLSVVAYHLGMILSTRNRAKHTR